ncbi:MAG: hypothetical protein WC381_07615 [Kiritimatiellia bacterium]|jgi:hypothetical protein
MKLSFSTTLRIVFALLAGVVPFIIGRVIFLDSPFTTDENSYLFQARLFLEGALARPLPPLPHLFDHEMIILSDRIGWLSRYSPGHPLWLMPGAAIGVPRLMSSLAAALGMWWLTGAALRLRLPVFLPGFLLLLSPWFLFMQGTLLSHTSGFAMTCLTIWGLVSWMTTGQVRYAAWAGVGWGWLYLIRPYTGVLLAVPFGLAALAHLWSKRDRSAWTGCALFAGTAAVGGGLFLLYNAWTTGDPFLPAYLFYDPCDALGFGPRRSIGPVVDHTWQLGVEQLGRSLRLLNRWLWGFPGSLALAGGLLSIGWRWKWTPLWLSGALAVWLGYILFYANTVDNIGPYYYYETLPMLVLGSALGVDRLWRWGAPWPRMRAHLAVLVALAAAGLSLAFMRVEGCKLNADRRYEARIQATLRCAPERSAVILDRIGFDHSGMKTVFNERGIDSDPIVVRYEIGCERQLAKAFPSHRLWMLRGGDEDRLHPVDFDDLPRHYFRAVDMGGFTGQNENDSLTGRPVRVARAPSNGADWMAAGSTLRLGPGRYDFRFDIATTACRSNAPVTLDVARPSNNGVLGQTVVWGTHPRGTAVVHVAIADVAGGYSALTRFTEIEPRVHFGGSGEARVYGIECVRRPD